MIFIGRQATSINSWKSAFPRVLYRCFFLLFGVISAHFTAVYKNFHLKIYPKLIFVVREGRYLLETWNF